MTEATRSWDVVICGGGLAGLTIARQLRRELPALRVAIVERQARPLPTAAHKVGESSVELGTAYFERLGLGEYLRRTHIVKFGLRFFPGGGDLPIDQRTEIGPSQEPVLPSFQLDRGLLEEDLRAMNESDGVTLVEGTMVRDVELGRGGALHRVVLEREGERSEITARWVVDATGRNALVKRRLKMKRGSRHLGNAGWFRVQGRVDPAELASTPSGPWHDVPLASERWRSTNHMMGAGYWAWLIPLSTGRTSVGLVTHDEMHGFERVHSHEKVMEFLREFEPVMARRLEGCEVLDFRCLKGYSHNVARSWSVDRWAIVGEAGAFVDPLYSPGSDFIAIANTFTVELIKAEIAGEELAPLVSRFNVQYRSLVAGSLQVYRRAAPVYGHARAMATKVYWDNFLYWGYTCQYFLQDLYRVGGEIATGIAMVGARFVELSDYVQELLRAWAERHPERPKAELIALPVFPSLAIDAHLELQNRLSPAEALALMRKRLGEGEQMVGELVVRAMLEFGPEEGRALLEAADWRRWRVQLDRRRLEVEPLTGLARRKAATVVVRDVERNLGRVQPHPQWRRALEELLGSVASASAESVAR
jgi:flavin-dependent dehydrogenase